MTFEYFCEKCQEVVERQFPLGKADKTVKCEKCGDECNRYFGSMNFQLKGGGWPSKKISFNQEMTKRNEEAGRRMWKERDGTQPKLVDQR